MSVSEISLPNPYVGPRSFHAGEVLYGRERELKDLLGLLVAERIVLLHWRSRAGQTSRVQAALLPQLQAEEFTVLPLIRVSIESSAVGHPLPSAGDNGRPTADDGHLNRYILSALLSLDEALPPEQQTPLDQLASLSLVEYLDRRPGPAEGDGEVLIFEIGRAHV